MKKKNIRGSCSHCGAGRWDHRAAKNKIKQNKTTTTTKKRERIPFLSPDNFFIS